MTWPSPASTSSTPQITSVLDGTELTVAEITARLRASNVDTTTVDVAIALGVMEELGTAKAGPFDPGCTRVWATTTPKDTP